MKYYLQDGGVITAKTASEFVENLKNSSRFDSESSAKNYMLNFSKRYKLYSGIDLATESFEAFLESLKTSGYITKTE